MEEIEVPKKKKGWPKGKPRGPRKPMEPLFEEPPPPVWVDGVMKDGSTFRFQCWSFDVSVTPWKFLSWAERRGRKVMRLLSPAQVVSINIEAPEEMFNPSPAQVAALIAPPPVPSSAPRVEVNPMLAEIRKNAGKAISKELPKSVLTDSEGRQQVVDAVIS